MQQFRHGTQRTFLLLEDLNDGRILAEAFERAVQQTQGLHWLAQVMTGRCQEPTLGFVGRFGGLPRRVDTGADHDDAASP